MKEKKSILKLILVTAIILVLPLIYFTSIGENPMKKKESATKTIAVINEDTGTEEDEEVVKFGNDVPPILKSESQYNWEVVGRSAGENGLNNQKYDAIVYIPSTFSEKILTYDENQPEQTKLEYTVQNQLNAINKEKVLLELEQATNRVNTKMSSLYWNYVSNDLVNIQQEFDQIVEKEKAFQQTMLSFYTPSSKDLAEQMEQQVSMLANLQSTSENAEERAADQTNTMEDFQENLANFVTYTNDYREYQQKQQEVLEQIQADSVDSISQATEMPQPMFMNNKELFEGKSESVLENMSQVENQMMQQQEMFAGLKELRYDQVERQVNDFYTLQERILNYYQQLKDSMVLNELEGEIATLSNKLGDGDEIVIPDDPELPEVPEDPEEPVDPEDPGEEEDPTEDLMKLLKSLQNEEPTVIDEDGETNGPTPVDLSSERNELLAIAQEIVTLQDTLIALEEPKVEDLQTASTTLLTLNDRIKQTEQQILAKEGGENPLDGELEELKKLIDTLTEENKSLLVQIEELTKEVEKLTKENETLSSQKETLMEQVDVLKESNTELKDLLVMVSDKIYRISSGINEKENAILASPALSQARKDTLSVYFQRPIKGANLTDVLQYYASLDRYEATLNSMLSKNNVKDTVLQDNDLREEVNSMLELTNKEEGQWDAVGTQVPKTSDALTTLQDDFTVFLADYKNVLDTQQAKLLESLNGIEEEADNVLNQMQQAQQQTPDETTQGTQVISNHDQVKSQMGSLYDWVDSIEDSQSEILTYTDELQSRVAEVQTDANTLNNKWDTNVASTLMIRDDVFNVMGNAFVDGRSNDYVYDFLATPIDVTGSVFTDKKDTNLPPVVILFIILLSSLLIGYASYYFQHGPWWLQSILFIMLTSIVGLVISLYSLTIYPLGNDRSMEWTIFTILLLLSCAALIRVAFMGHHLLGWLVTVGLVALFVTPLLALSTPNFSFTDPMSRVYMSIQNSTQTLFTEGAMILTAILIVLIIIQYALNKRSWTQTKEDEAHEA
ncbi:type VII secretion protein EsaA [Guptibacillus hwajinpoensis]|uniref:type VII secretion protein EsaA n=1 Tax=Guptibacillus hwajinpoensis TaxID=208199 RepID=UPI001CFC9073|nr:type VII secretion protein EsaA [Pseudalkalibacillus hwajinpoensis]WLR60970.1 type VII secretion protein EsaA [Pseudalkalibacillus hwajinpoensis]